MLGAPANIKASHRPTHGAAELIPSMDEFYVINTLNHSLNLVCIVYKETRKTKHLKALAHAKGHHGHTSKPSALKCKGIQLKTSSAFLTLWSECSIRFENYSIARHRGMRTWSILTERSMNHDLLMAGENQDLTGWIGLHRDDVNVSLWRWSGEGKMRYQNWAKDQPNNKDGKQSVVQMWSDGKWNDISPVLFSPGLSWFIPGLVLV
uniref:C-type lectin domain-containing protein n=1 Tax=Periophthalmus magnuspinnatus TaxID=409849 RepID=A0A3B4BEK5_9GOBI